VDKSKYKLVYESQPYPQLAFGVPHNLPPELRDKVKSVFANFKFAGTSLDKRYASQGRIGFTPVNYQKDWEVVRRVDDTLTHLLDGQ